VKLSKGLFFLSVLLVTGCGGGGEKNSGASSSIPTNNIVDDPLKEFIEAKFSYNGNTEKAQVNRDELGKFFEYFFFVAQDLNPSYLGAGTSVDTERLCTNGGNVTFSGTKKIEEKRVVFDNCIDGEFYFHGNATLRADISSSGEVKSSAIIFENVATKSSFGEFTLLGIMTDANTKGSCPITFNVFNFLLKNTDGSQILFDNMTVYSAGNMNEGCSDELDGITTSGKIYDSALGYWEFETTDRFRLKKLLPWHNDRGELSIKGQNNDTAVWTITPSDDRASIATIEHDVNIYESKTGIYTKYRYSGSYMSEGLLFSFADNDNDGIQDSWEMLFGLDPSNKDDAFLDDDSDGFNNQIEFLYRGIPNNSGSYPEVADISAVIMHKSKSYSEDIPISLYIRNVSKTSPAINVTATLKTSAPLQFIDNNENCKVSKDRLLMVCSYPSIGKRDELLLDYFLTADINIVDEITSQVTVELTSESFDPRLINNSYTSYVKREKLEFNYLADIENEDRSSHSYALLKENESVAYSLRYRPINEMNGSVDYLKSATLNFTTSDSVELTNGLCFIDNSWKDCLKNGSFDIANSIRNGVIDIKYTITGVTSDHGYVQFKLTDSVTGQRAYKDILFPVIVGKPSSIIQQKIDDAAEGGEVVVDKGIYIGGLDLATKKVDLTSVQGFNSTYIYRHLDMYDDFIAIGKESSLSGFSIAQMYISVKDGGGIIKNNAFIVPAYRMSGTLIDVSDSLDFTKNIIRAELVVDPVGESNTYNRSSCFSINADGVGASSIHLDVTNNLYTSTVTYSYSDKNACSFLSLYGGNSLYFANNTIYGLNRTLWLYQQWLYDDESNLIIDGNYKVEFENNIISTTSSLVYFNNSRGDFIYSMDKESQILLNNNLLYKVEYDFSEDMINPTSLDKIWSEGLRITTEPLFNLDWGLRANSPAIDAGMPNKLTLDLKNNLRSIDGNNDGVSVVDIGALEFKLD